MLSGRLILPLQFSYYVSYLAADAVLNAAMEKLRVAAGDLERGRRDKADALLVEAQESLVEKDLANASPVVVLLHLQASEPHFSLLQEFVVELARLLLKLGRNEEAFHQSGRAISLGGSASVKGRAAAYQARAAMLLQRRDEAFGLYLLAMQLPFEHAMCLVHHYQKEYRSRKIALEDDVCSVQRNIAIPERRNEQ
jgi:hypothetical protein